MYIYMYTGGIYIAVFSACVAFQSPLSFGFSQINPVLRFSDDKTIFENCLIFISDSKLERPKILIPILDMAVKKKKPLVILAEDFGTDVLTLLILNHK